MHLFYLGQSGDTGNSAADAAQPHHVITGLLLHESQCIALNGEFDALCRRHFGAPLGEDGAPPEVRPAELYQGRRHFAGWKPARRAELVQDCLDLLIRREAPVLAAYLRKQDLIDGWRSPESAGALLWRHPAEPALSRLLFALSMYLDEESLATLNHEQLMAGQLPVTEFTQVVAPAGGGIEPGYLRDFLRSDEGQDAAGLMESFHFAAPQSAAALQLANLCAYFIRRWLQRPDAAHPYLEAIRDNRVLQVIYPVQL